MCFSLHSKILSFDENYKGVYNNEEYLMCSNLVLIELPFPKSFGSIPVSPDLKTLVSHHQGMTDASCYFLVHSRPIPSECQKFLCDNANEANVLFHPWVYRDSSIDFSFVNTQQVDCALFDTYGIVPVHQDLKDGGVSFGTLDARTVSIHSLCFSPENNQFQIDENSNLGCFFSFGKIDDRCVLCFHVVPFSDEEENKLRSIAKDEDNILGLAEALRSFLPEKYKEISDFLLFQSSVHAGIE